MDQPTWTQNPHRQKAAERAFKAYFEDGVSYSKPTSFAEAEDILDDLIERGIFGMFDAETEYMRMRIGAMFNIPYTDCDGFNGENAWGGCSKCGLKLEQHAPTGLIL